MITDLKVDSLLLADLLGLSRDDETAWRPQDLREIFLHQLRARLPQDVIAGNSPTTYGELLQHTSPPIKGLLHLKTFAKANRDGMRADVPPEVATVLYFATIAAARVHCGQNISTLDHAAREKGFEWSTQQPWIDLPTRALLDEARRLDV